MIIVLIRIKSLYFLIQTTFIDDNDDKINERKNSFEHKSINHKEKRLFLFLARTKQNKNKKERERDQKQPQSPIIRNRFDQIHLCQFDRFIHNIILICMTIGKNRIRLLHLLIF